MRALVPLALVLLSCASLADTYRERSVIPAFSISDQHGQAHRIDESVRGILFNREMKAGEIIKEVLAQDGKQLLDRTNAVYVADVSGMPGIIRRIFAEPKMRERPYPMLLDKNGSLTERFPSVEGKATLIVLNELEIVGIEHVGSAGELRTSIEKLSRSEKTQP